MAMYLTNERMAYEQYIQPFKVVNMVIHGHGHGHGIIMVMRLVMVMGNPSDSSTQNQKICSGSYMTMEDISPWSYMTLKKAIFGHYGQF